MPSRLMPDDEVLEITEDVFSWMCSLAMEKCAKKSEKKKASCGGEAMRKRLLIKNFVAQMIDHERRGTNGEHSPYAGEDEERMEVDVVDVDGDDGGLSMVISDRSSYESEADDEEEEYEEDGDGSEADDDEDGESPDEPVEAENSRATASYNCGLASSLFSPHEHGVPVPELHAQTPAYFATGYCSQLQLYAEAEPSAGRAALSPDMPDWSFHDHSSPLQTPNSRYSGGYNGESSTLLCPLEQSSFHFLYPIDVSSPRRPSSPVPNKDSSQLGLELAFNEGEKDALSPMANPIPTQSDSTRAFASLSNVAFTPLPKIGSCRSEFASLHYHHQSSKSITDLDTHITMLEEEEDSLGGLSRRQIVVSEDGHTLADTQLDISQRKRHFPPNFHLTVGEGSDGALPLSPSFFGSKRVKL